MTDFRVLCADLLVWAEKASAHYYQQPEVLARARTALAQAEPEVVGPTRRQLMLLADDMDMASVSDAAEYARAVLARWGNYPVKPDSSAPAPVGERQVAPLPVLPEDAQVIEPSEHTILVPVPVPVAVADRIPRPEDCNGDEEVWAWRPFDSESDMDGGDFWSLAFHEWLEDEDCGFTHWLPAHALPLPSGEVEHG